MSFFQARSALASDWHPQINRPPKGSFRFLAKPHWPVFAYIAIGIGAMFMIDADSDHNQALALTACAFGSILLGCARGRWSSVWLALLLAPLAMPFGYPSSEFAEPLLLWMEFVLLTPVSMLLISAGVVARRLVGRKTSPG